ncbi:cobalamin biosynthesis protein [Nocardia asteroides]|uniref:cobalamin biosynthesis protein n=1 Tax=Nocardia asteroides TaxID=1824 RepID=UPI0033D8D1F7
MNPRGVDTDVTGAIRQNRDKSAVLPSPAPTTPPATSPPSSGRAPDPPTTAARATTSADPDAPPASGPPPIDGTASRPRAIVSRPTDPAGTVALADTGSPIGRTGSGSRATSARARVPADTAASESGTSIGGKCPDPTATVTGRERVRVVVGLGLRPGTDAETITRAIDAVIGAAAVTVTGLATIDRRAAEAGLRSAAKRLGVPVIACRAEELAQVDTPHRSPRVVRAVGTPSVAEAAALLAGRGELVCGRTVVGGVVVAVATVAGGGN